MAEGTRFSKLEVVTEELQKKQSGIDEKLSAMGTRMSSMEETMNGYKESFINMQEMMRRLLQNQKKKHTEASLVPSHHLGLDTDMAGAASLFAGKGLKVDVQRFNGIEAEDWVFKIKEFFDIYGVPVEQRIKIASFHMEGQV